MKNINPDEFVMNNKDLRRIIFSFFRNKPEIVCSTCKKACVFNGKIVRKYIDIPILDHTVIYHQCQQCYWSAGTREIMGY